MTRCTERLSTYRKGDVFFRERLQILNTVNVHNQAYFFDLDAINLRDGSLA